MIIVNDLSMYRKILKIVGIVLCFILVIGAIIGGFIATEAMSKKTKKSTGNRIVYDGDIMTVVPDGASSMSLHDPKFLNDILKGVNPKKKLGQQK